MCSSGAPPCVRPHTALLNRSPVFPHDIIPHFSGYCYQIQVLSSSREESAISPPSLCTEMTLPSHCLLYQPAASPCRQSHSDLRPLSRFERQRITNKRPVKPCIGISVSHCSFWLNVLLITSLSDSPCTDVHRVADSHLPLSIHPQNIFSICV